MSLSNTFENEVLKNWFNNDDIPNVGDAAGIQNSATAGNLYVAGHTADPGEAGAQNTNECTYTGYARAPVPRSTAGWTVTNNEVVNAALIQLGQRTDAGAAQEILFWSVGKEVSGTTVILAKGFCGNITSRLAFTAATDDFLTCPGHALANTDRVVVYAEPGATLPTGISEGTVYFVRDVTGNTFKLAATSGGAAIDLTAAGAGFIGKISSAVSVTQNINPQFAAGVLKIQIG